MPTRSMKPFCAALLLVLSSLCVWASEHHCSKYDFEEKILEKLVRMEFNEKQQRSEFDSIKSDVIEKLGQTELLSNEVNNAAKEMHRKVEDSVKSLEEKFSHLEKKITDKLQSIQEATQTIAFKARLNTDTTVSNGQTMVFPVVMFNHGSGYEPSTGIFTAPVDGTYMFEILLCVITNKHVDVVIVTDDNEVNTNALFYGNAGNTCFSANAFIVLKANQKTKVRVGSNTNSGPQIDHAASRWNTFSGVLIHT